MKRLGLNIGGIVLVFFLTAVSALSDELRVVVIDPSNNPIDRAVVRGLIEFEDGSILLFQANTEKNGEARISCGEGIKVYLFVGKIGWFGHPLLGEVALGIPEALNISKTSDREFRIVLMRNNPVFKIKNDHYF